MPNVDIDMGEVPEYEVIKTEEGRSPDVDVEGGNMPEYDVDAADVDLETETVEMEVPTGVDVEMPDEDTPEDEMSEEDNY